MKGSRDQLLDFQTPSIYREWFKLETSNLARMLITRGSKEKMQNYVKWVGKGSCDLLFKFWDPSYLGNG